MVISPSTDELAEETSIPGILVEPQNHDKRHQGLPSPKATFSDIFKPKPNLSKLALLIRPKRELIAFRLLIEDYIEAMFHGERFSRRKTAHAGNVNEIFFRSTFHQTKMEFSWTGASNQTRSRIAEQNSQAIIWGFRWS